MVGESSRAAGVEPGGAPKARISTLNHPLSTSNSQLLCNLFEGVALDYVPDFVVVEIAELDAAFET